jgi:glycosyltransferase involved in cell wall biosynthesis
VVIVGNTFAPYSRGLRIARTLVEAGYDVEIAAMAGPGLPRDDREGPIRVCRYGQRTPGGPNDNRGRFGPKDGTRPRQSLRGRGWRRLVRVPRRFWWPRVDVRGWWAGLEAELEPADLYHCCGVYALPPALTIAARQGGRRPVVIYDVVDDWFRSSLATSTPAPLRWIRMFAEARRARVCDAIVAVNAPQAKVLERRWRPRRSVLCVPNFPMLDDAPASKSDLIRQELGLAPDVAVVLYWGLLGSRAALRIAEEAVLQVPGAVYVVIGFGRGFEASRALDGEPRFRGRHFTLPARHPDELLRWTASADVALMRFNASSPNDRLTTPNKLWEALAAGTPVVVGRAQGPMAAFVERHDAGAVAEQMTPESVAAAIRRILGRSAAERDVWRQRLAGEARRSWTWPVAAAGYRNLVRTLETERDR